MTIPQVAKAITAALVAGLGALTALQVNGNGHIDTAGYVTIAVATITAFLATWSIPNAPHPTVVGALADRVAAVEVALPIVSSMAANQTTNRILAAGTMVQTTPVGFDPPHVPQGAE